jgi:hypothetical protein
MSNLIINLLLFMFIIVLHSCLVFITGSLPSPVAPRSPDGVHPIHRFLASPPPSARPPPVGPIEPPVAERASARRPSSWPRRRAGPRCLPPHWPVPGIVRPAPPRPAPAPLGPAPFSLSPPPGVRGGLGCRAVRARASSIRGSRAVVAPPPRVL